MQDNMTEIQGLQTAPRDLTTGDLTPINAVNNPNATAGQIAISNATTEEQAQMNSMRNNMANGTFTYKTAGPNGTPIGLNDVAGQAGGVNYTYADLVTTGSEEQYTNISEEMSKN